MTEEVNDSQVETTEEVSGYKEFLQNIEKNTIIKEFDWDDFNKGGRVKQEVIAQKDAPDKLKITFRTPLVEETLHADAIDSDKVTTLQLYRVASSLDKLEGKLVSGGSIIFDDPLVTGEFSNAVLQENVAKLRKLPQALFSVILSNTLAFEARIANLFSFSEIKKN